MIFYYVRHGDPIYNPDSLTELGHKQAEALAKRFALYGLDEIYCSTSMRAQMTAQPTCKILGKEMTLLDWTNERYAQQDFGLYLEDGTWSWIFRSEKYIRQMNSPEVRALGVEWHKHPYFEGSPFTKGVERVNRETDLFFRQLGFEHDRENACYLPIAKEVPKQERRVALFAHDGFGKSFLSSVLDLPYAYVATRFDLTHSSVTVLHFDEKTKRIYPKILQMSNDSHLYKEEILNGYNNWLDI